VVSPKMTLRLMIVLTSLLAAVAARAGEKPGINTSHGSLAMEGYDAVSYFDTDKPQKGSPQFEWEWNGAVWRFLSEDHRDRFEREPARYAPQYGGYCAYAVSRGHTANGDPEVWKIVGDKLYLNNSKLAHWLWERDVPGNIVKGDANWPGVLSK
jgi:hypothetical protein